MARSEVTIAQEEMAQMIARQPAADVAASGRQCKQCGCTDNAACDPPCWWVDVDLCSAHGDASPDIWDRVDLDQVRRNVAASRKELEYLPPDSSQVAYHHQIIRVLEEWETDVLALRAFASSAKES